MNMSSVRERMNRLESMELGSGASIDQISEAEKALMVRLPTSLRKFLQEFGWICSPWITVYGLGSDMPSQLNIVKNTHSERYDCLPNIKEYMIAIMNDGAGNNYCLDTSAFEDDECPVVFWDHELGDDQTPEFVARNFDEWLEIMVNDAEEFQRDGG